MNKAILMNEKTNDEGLKLF